MRGNVFGVIALAAALLQAAPAAAKTFGLVDLEGRWKADGRDLVLDFAPCGKHVCAVLVKADASCGALVMQMDKMDRGSDDDLIILEGRLDLPGESAAYDHALVQPGFDPNGKPALDITAHDKLHFEMRDYAFEAALVRTGSAVCRAGPTS